MNNERILMNISRQLLYERLITLDEQIRMETCIREKYKGVGHEKL